MAIDTYTLKNDNTADTVSARILGFIKATRPHFIFAYLAFSIGGIILGRLQGYEAIDRDFFIFSVLTIVIAAIGIHYRDEVADWNEGFDLEVGGMGVIREGILTPRPLYVSGIFFTVMAFIMMGALSYYRNMLLIIFVPISVILIWANHLTEKVTLGHEAVAAFSFTAATLWVYLGQGWDLNRSVALYSVFTFLITFSFIPYQDIGDYEVDLKNGKKTLAVSLGLDRLGHLCIFIGIFALLFLYASLVSIA